MLWKKNFEEKHYLGNHLKILHNKIKNHKFGNKNQNDLNNLNNTNKMSNMNNLRNLRNLSDLILNDNDDEVNNIKPFTHLTFRVKTLMKITKTNNLT